MCFIFELILCVLVVLIMVLLFVVEVICSLFFVRVVMMEEWFDICELIDCFLLCFFDFLLDLLMLLIGVKLLGEVGLMCDVMWEIRDLL